MYTIHTYLVITKWHNDSINTPLHLTYFTNDNSHMQSKIAKIYWVNMMELIFWLFSFFVDFIKHLAIAKLARCWLFVGVTSGLLMSRNLIVYDKASHVDLGMAELGMAEIPYSRGVTDGAINTQSDMFTGYKHRALNPVVSGKVPHYFFLIKKPNGGLLKQDRRRLTKINTDFNETLKITMIWLTAIDGMRSLHNLSTAK